MYKQSLRIGIIRALHGLTPHLHIDSLVKLIEIGACLTHLMRIDSLVKMVVLSFIQLMHIDSLENITVMRFTQLMHIAG